MQIHKSKTLKNVHGYNHIEVVIFPPVITAETDTDTQSALSYPLCGYASRHNHVYKKGTINYLCGQFKDVVFSCEGIM